MSLGLKKLHSKEHLSIVETCEGTAELSMHSNFTEVQIASFISPRFAQEKGNKHLRSFFFFPLVNYY